MLKISNIEVIYNKVILVLRGVTINVSNGSIVALLGANGAGKSTTLKAVSGLLMTELGEVVKGDIVFKEKSIKNMKPEHIVKMGLIQVQEGRRLFNHLTTEENIKAGGLVSRDRLTEKKNMDIVYSHFPILKERRKGVSGYLSGGERQMLVIARALMANPEFMMLDEPSLGLAPIIINDIFSIIQNINKIEKKTILLVEQNAKIALRISQHGYVMEMGRVVLDDPSDKLMNNEDVKQFYLGIGELGQRTSYRDVKHYKRRKRWLG